jgi:hypothetical protein
MSPRDRILCPGADRLRLVQAELRCITDTRMKDEADRLGRMAACSKSAPFYAGHGVAP